MSVDTPIYCSGGLTRLWCYVYVLNVMLISASNSRKYKHVSLSTWQSKNWVVVVHSDHRWAHFTAWSNRMLTIKHNEDDLMICRQMICKDRLPNRLPNPSLGYYYILTKFLHTLSLTDKRLGSKSLDCEETKQSHKIQFMDFTWWRSEVQTPAWEKYGGFD